MQLNLTFLADAYLSPLGLTNSRFKQQKTQTKNETKPNIKGLTTLKLGKS